MKLRNLILAGAIAGTALAGLGAYGSKINETCVPGNADYEAGTGICNVKNAAAAKAQAEKNAAAAKKQAEADKAEALRKANAKKEQAERDAQAKLWQPTKRNISGLAYACESQRLQPALKDPNSLRVLDKGMAELTDTHVTVFVRYTATNNFGGRIQDVHTCTYTR